MDKLNSDITTRIKEAKQLDSTVKELIKISNKLKKINLSWGSKNKKMYEQISKAIANVNKNTGEILNQNLNVTHLILVGKRFSNISILIHMFMMMTTILFT